MIPVLIFDNVDPLSVHMNQIIFNEALRLEDNFQVKVIISMRKSTFNELANRPDGTIRANPPREFWLQKPNMERYLNRRIAVAINKVNKKPIKVTPSDGPTIKFPDAKKVLLSTMNNILSKERIDVLDYLSYHNMRKVNTLIITYLSSGFLDDFKIASNLLKGEVLKETDWVSPFWVLLSSIITNNHDTYFFRAGIPCHSGNFVNLYDSGMEHNCRYMIRIHILNFLARQYAAGSDSRNNHYVELNEMIKKYKSVNKKADQEIITTVIRDLMQTFLYCDLITSPEYYGLQKKHNINKVKLIALTDTGNFFLTLFRNYYEYLVYMKDGVELHENPNNIKDCIQVTRFAPRYDNVYRFLSMVFEKETEFTKEMDGDQRDIFQTNFSFNREPFVVALPVDNMIEFGETFKSNQSNNDTKSETEIETTIQKLIKLKAEITNVRKSLFSQ